MIGKEGINFNSPQRKNIRPRPPDVQDPIPHWGDEGVAECLPFHPNEIVDPWSQSAERPPLEFRFAPPYELDSNA